MFGKGIYFADSVSKSANYCFTNKQNPTGILLLCDVALGNMSAFLGHFCFYVLCTSLIQLSVSVILSTKDEQNFICSLEPVQKVKSNR